MKTLCQILSLIPFILSGQVLAAEGPGGMREPFVDLSKTSDEQLVMRVRPLMRKIAPHDAWRVAINWSRPDGPLEHHGGVQGPDVDLAKTLTGSKFIIESPDGVTRELTAKLIDRRHEYWRGLHPLFRQATLILALDNQGIHVSFPFGEMSGKWHGDTAPDLKRPGRYKFQISGALNDAQFHTGKIAIAVDPQVQLSKSAFEVARREIAKHLPKAKLAEKPGWTESGYVPGLIHEDVSGRRLLDFNTKFSERRWGYELVRVKVTRGGELAGVYYRSVSTCVAQAHSSPRPKASEQSNRCGRVMLCGPTTSRTS